MVCDQLFLVFVSLSDGKAVTGRVEYTLMRLETVLSLEVNINAEEGWISIANNGATLPVEIHKDRSRFGRSIFFFFFRYSRAGVREKVPCQ